MQFRGELCAWRLRSPEAMCVLRGSSQSGREQGSLAAPTHPAACLELLHARRAWTILCQHSQARLCTDPLPIDIPSPQAVRVAWIPAIIWGWALKGEAWTCAAQKEQQKTEAPSQHFALWVHSLNTAQDASSEAVVVPPCTSHSQAEGPPAQGSISYPTGASGTSVPNLLGF